MRRDAGVDRVGARAHLASLLSAILRCVERYVKRVARPIEAAVCSSRSERKKIGCQSYFLEENHSLQGDNLIYFHLHLIVMIKVYMEI